MSILDPIQFHLARRSTRRGLLGRMARATALVGASALGLVGLQSKAAAADACCNLASGTRCTTCPNCPPSHPIDWWWTCCYNGCKYFCRDCYNSELGTYCSCFWSDNSNCGGICSFSPAP